MAELKMDPSLELVKNLLQKGVDPLEILDQCNQAMIEVGKLYERGVYYTAGLIMAGEIMRRIGQLVFPMVERRVSEAKQGTIVLGTVEGDIHFIGKDIFKVLAQSHGLSVHDLGVNVPAGRFVGAIHEFKPDIVGLSCLISGAFDPMKETIKMMRTSIPENIAPRAYIIGGRVDESLRREVSADFWVNDAMKGVRICQQVMGIVSSAEKDSRN